MKEAQAFDKYKYAQLLLLLLWIVVQGFLLVWQGIITNQEAEKYINEARHLINDGGFSEKKYFFYASTILLIACCSKTGLGVAGVVLVQIALNGLSTVLLYQISRKLSNGSHRVAFITVLLFITWYPLQKWNTYLFTESLFFSVILLFTWLLVFRRALSMRNMVTWILGLALTMITRPFGLLFIPAFVAYLHFKIPRRLRYISLLAIVTGLICFYYFLNFVFTGGHEMDAMKPFIEEHTICLLPDKAQHPPLVLSKSTQPVYQMFYYIFHNPLHFLNLAAKRLLAFFGLYRSYYSNLHNAYLVTSIICIYSFALYGLKRFFHTVASTDKAFILAAICIFPIAITFQCDDYHNRFIMPIFPYFFLIAAFGADQLLSRLRQKKGQPI